MSDRRLVKYGIDFIPAETIYKGFEDIVQPERLGFTRIKHGMYAKPASPCIFHILSLQAYKGRNYGIRWGISLTYVPHGWEQNLRWHKTLKGCRFDLFEEPASYPSFAKLRVPHYTVPTIYGETCFRSELVKLWADFGLSIMEWFASTSSVEEVLQKADEQMKRKWELRHYPDPAVVHLLTLAKLGDTEAALNRLNTLSKETVEYLGLEHLSKAAHIVAETGR
jgi:hypothetical protein